MQERNDTRQDLKQIAATVTKSKAKSTTLDSAVKISEHSGSRTADSVKVLLRNKDIITLSRAKQKRAFGTCAEREGPDQT